MRRFVAWIGIFGLGLLLGRLPTHPRGPEASDDAIALQEIVERRQSLVESAREQYEAHPDSFMAASRLAVLLSMQRGDQQRQASEFGMQVKEPVFEPELQAMIRESRRLARTKVEKNLVHGLTRRTSRQNLDAEKSGAA